MRVVIAPTKLGGVPERPRSRQRPVRAALSQGGFQPLPALSIVAAHKPEPAVCCTEPERQLCFVPLDCPAQGRAQVIVLLLQPVQPDPEFPTIELRLGRFRQCQVIRRMLPL
jgi:hypothetical protein